jgi:hypothetical protein
VTASGLRGWTLLAAALVAAAPPGRAAEPRSAIPWLSQSIETVGTLPPPSRPRPGPPAQPGDDVIIVTPLGSVSRDAVGLLPPEETGFARALWGAEQAGRVRELILAQPAEGVPAARALFHRLLLAEADPPAGADPGSAVLVARIDRLLEAGALDEAGALIDRAGPATPDLFRRWFDVGLLLDRAAGPCAALRENPTLSPTLPARVFCLARSGDWNAAEITLTLGSEVGSIASDQERLLGWFLDPALFEGEEEPPVPEPLTALDFLMREAVGLSRPAGPLPLAFLHADLGPHAPLRARIEAAERLALAGAIPPARLLATYRSGVPAASGGVWDRAQAIQRLDAALADGADLGAALVAADATLTQRGLRVALAAGYADALAGLDPAGLDPAGLAPSARQALFELLLLAGRPDAAARAAGPSPDPRQAALLAIARGGPGDPAGDELTAAALGGLTAAEPADDRERGLAATVAAGRQGEAILAALALVRAGAAVDPPSLRTALLTLRLAGQPEAARAIALETLLAGEPA